MKTFRLVDYLCIPCRGGHIRWINTALPKYPSLKYAFRRTTQDIKLEIAMKGVGFRYE